MRNTKVIVVCIITFFGAKIWISYVEFEFQRATCWCPILVADFQFGCRWSSDFGQLGALQKKVSSSVKSFETEFIFSILGKMLAFSPGSILDTTFEIFGFVHLNYL